MGSGFSFSSFLDFILSYMYDMYVWMDSTFPFKDVPISLFYIVVGMSLTAFLYEFLPVHHDDDNN